MNDEKRALLEKVFGVPARLRIMSALVVRKEVDFTGLIDLLDLTRGNLSMHMKTLEDHGFAEVRKTFVKKKPRTSYKATPRGRNEFASYVEILENIIATIKTGEVEDA